MTEISWAPARRRGRPPASDSALTRERILQAALKVFAEFGYEAATFQAIAVEIGLTRPAINNYFSNKPALYAAVVRRVSDAISDAIGNASQAPTLAEQVVAFIRSALSGDDADPALAAFLVQAAMDDQHLPVTPPPWSNGSSAARWARRCDAGKSAMKPTVWPTC